jgi:ParB-like chromosome segregation protein Spo0J
MKYSFHELADVFRLIEGDEFDALVADIAKNGLIEPIVLLEDKILDGRNRYRACLAAGVDPVFRPFQGDDPIAFVIGANIRRRHLDESQRAMAAATLATRSRGTNQWIGQLAAPTQEQAANMLNVGERSLRRAREVREHGAPELVSAVERGDVSVSAAADLAGSVPKERQAELVAAGPKAAKQAAKQIRDSKKPQTKKAVREAEKAKKAQARHREMIKREQEAAAIVAEAAALDEADRSVCSFISKLIPEQKLSALVTLLNAGRYWNNLTEALVKQFPDLVDFEDPKAYPPRLKIKPPPKDRRGSKTDTAPTAPISEAVATPDDDDLPTFLDRTKRATEGGAAAEAK